MKYLRLLPLLVIGACTTEALVEIQSSRFADMVNRGDISKVVLIKNEDQIEITLKAEALQKAIYKQELERSSPFGINPNGPHYKMKIGSTDKFLDKYEAITKDIPREQQVDLQVEERVSSPLSVLVPVVVLVVGGITWLAVRSKNKRPLGQESPNAGQAGGDLIGKANARTRYPALSTIAGIYMVFAWMVGTCTVVAAVVVTNIVSGWAAGLVLLVGGLLALGLAAASECIRVFLDIEYNTRTKGL